jgi:hypothetical protein
LPGLASSLTSNASLTIKFEFTCWFNKMCLKITNDGRRK